MTTRAFTIADLVPPGGGRIGIAPLPGREGRLAADVATIAAWRPSVVVSMTEDDEMAQAGAAGLPARLAALDLVWRHFPVVDFGTPERGDTRWPVLAAELHAALDAGGRVLLHCHGGKGRSGMAAMRLLVERGLSPAEALVAARTARPGSVETADQEDWAAEGIRTRPRS
jgi:protein-tyrosine phosphatase